MNHTKGPWTIDQYGSVKDTTGETVRINGVALPGQATAEDKANTRLVAAAPELLEALHDMMHYAYDYGMPFEHEARLKARAAIAKALGEGE